MYYKLKIEEFYGKETTIITTEVYVTEEMIISSPSIDVLKMCASQLIDKHRSSKIESYE
jgi:hypothetical protein